MPSIAFPCRSASALSPPATTLTAPTAPRTGLRATVASRALSSPATWWGALGLAGRRILNLGTAEICSLWSQCSFQSGGGFGFCGDFNCVECPGSPSICKLCEAGYALQDGACVKSLPPNKEDCRGVGCQDCSEDGITCYRCEQGRALIRNTVSLCVRLAPRGARRLLSPPAHAHHSSSPPSPLIQLVPDLRVYHAKLRVL